MLNVRWLEILLIAYNSAFYRITNKKENGDIFFFKKPVDGIHRQSKRWLGVNIHGAGASMIVSFRIGIDKTKVDVSKLSTVGECCDGPKSLRDSRGIIRLGFVCYTLHDGQ